MALKIQKEECENILGFDPFSKLEEDFVVEITPEMAQYILDNHNYDNRKMVKSQLSAIKASISKYGFLWDGGTLVFTISGNILEFQHRLQAIVDLNITVKVIVVTGVDPSVFTKQAPAKTRTATDVINKKDKTVTNNHVTTLRQLLKRRAGESTCTNNSQVLRMENAYELWKEWKPCILQGMSLTSDFFDGTLTCYDSWERQFNAWASLMVFTEQENLIQPFLQKLKDHKLNNKKSTLFEGMDEWFMRHTYELSGESKARAVHFMLCHATDRFIMKPDSQIEWKLTGGNANHTDMVKKGTYRNFLSNPQGLPKIKTVN